MTYSAAQCFPTTSEAAVKEHYLGKRLQDVQTPVPVIDQAVARRNCKLMLDAARSIGVGFRAHVKTHKTIQLAQLQVGFESTDIRLIVSTVAEAEHMLPWLLESKAQGKKIFYGLPVCTSAVPRLACIAQRLETESIGLFVDHPDHISMLNNATWPHENIPVMVKADVGYHRAGVEKGKPQFTALAKAISTAERVQLMGLYAHMGHSYGVSSPEEALTYLTMELQELEACAAAFADCMDSKGHRPLILSLGASPTTTAAQNLSDRSVSSRKCLALLERTKQTYSVELHAGVYPLLDMQQLATHARPEHAIDDPAQSLLSFQNLGLRVLVEVASVYNDRDQPEALVAAGSIVLGREPCKSYPGWGVVSSWPSADGQIYDPDGEKTGWVVSSISQEHGILRWQGSKDNFRALKLGDKLLIWPNHACMAGPNFSFYAVVDSSRSNTDEIVDVWIRCRGW